MAWKTANELREITLKTLKENNSEACALVDDILRSAEEFAGEGCGSTLYNVDGFDCDQVITAVCMLECLGYQIETKKNNIICVRW